MTKGLILSSCHPVILCFPSRWVRIFACVTSTKFTHFACATACPRRYDHPCWGCKPLGVAGRANIWRVSRGKLVIGACPADPGGHTHPARAHRGAVAHRHWTYAWSSQQPTLRCAFVGAHRDNISDASCRDQAARGQLCAGGGARR